MKAAQIEASPCPTHSDEPINIHQSPSNHKQPTSCIMMSSAQSTGFTSVNSTALDVIVYSKYWVDCVYPTESTSLFSHHNLVHRCCLFLFTEHPSVISLLLFWNVVFRILSQTTSDVSPGWREVLYRGSRH